MKDMKITIPTTNHHAFDWPACGAGRRFKRHVWSESRRTTMDQMRFAFVVSFLREPVERVFVFVFFVCSVAFVVSVTSAVIRVIENRRAEDQKLE